MNQEYQNWLDGLKVGDETVIAEESSSGSGC